MAEVLALRGLPGSGKSTLACRWTTAGDYARVNRDDLRKSVFGQTGVLAFEKEEMITRIQREIAAAALLKGKDVVVDDTNLRNKYLRAWNEFALDHGASFRVYDVITPVDTCVRRDSARDRSVGEKVIRDLARKFLRNGEFPAYEPIEREPVKPYHNDPFLPHIVIVDIDGTMALNNGHRGWYEWAAVGADEPNEPVVDVVRGLIYSGTRVVFLSGRDSVCRMETLDWLTRHLPPGYTSRWSLFMRAEGDTREDSIIKREIFDRKIRDQYHVKFILDDRDQVVRMWRSLGLSVFQVAEGNF